MAMAGRGAASSASDIPGEGLTVVRDPDTEPVADILFVHGFTGHPYLTWRHKNGTLDPHPETQDDHPPPTKSRRLHLFSRPRDGENVPRGPVYWPADLLPNTTPDARILTFGYDTHIKHRLVGPPPSKNTVYDIAWDLLVALEAARRGAPERPLLLVAHSLGGIAVKEMLRRAHGCGDGMDHLRQIATSTVGIVFFGTPHSGADPRSFLLRTVEALARGLGWTVSRQVVDDLLPSSEKLRELRDEFAPMAQKEGWLIHSFQEQVGVSYLGGNKVVDDTSSYLSCRSIEVTQHIASNHMEMCRFQSRDDPEYRKVAAALERLLQSSREGRAGPCSSVEGPQNLSAERIRELLKTLEFDTMGDRQAGIKRAHHKTCKWFLEQPEYKDWLDETKAARHHGVLWIKGNPGTGKSTLMKYLLERARSKRGGRTTQPKKIVSFFFHARGETLEKSTAGMYRHLIFKLLNGATDDEVVAVWSHFVDLSGFEEYARLHWMISLLEDLFRAAVLVLKRRLVCFVDALDECCEKEIQNMLSFFSGLGEECSKQGTHFHVCLSSRYYPQIVFEKGLSLKLEGQEGHTQDIVDYLQSELHIGTSKIAQTVRTETLEKASGIFMWVVLVTQILNDEFARGNIHELRKKLRDIPSDLDRLFESILTRDGRDQDQMLLCIQWILFSRTPLRPEELYFGILSGRQEVPAHEFVDDSPISKPWDPEEITRKDIENFILSSSKGLAEVTASKKKPTAQFIHESVRDYLLHHGGLGKVWPDLGDSFSAASHDVLKNCCLKYIRSRNSLPSTPTSSSSAAPQIGEDYPESTQESGPSTPAAQVEEDAPESTQELSERDQLCASFPFLPYALRNILYHADAAQAGGISQSPFLDSFPTKLWVRLDNRVVKHKSRRHTEDVAILYLLAEQNASNLIRVCPIRTSCVPGSYQQSQERYGIPLVAAIAHGAHEAIRQLLLSDKVLSDVADISELTEDALDPSSTQTTHKGRQLTLRWERHKPILLYLDEYGHLPFIQYFLSAAVSISWAEPILHHFAALRKPESMRALLRAMQHRPEAGLKLVHDLLSVLFRGGNFLLVIQLAKSGADATGLALGVVGTYLVLRDDTRCHYLEMLKVLQSKGYDVNEKAKSALTHLQAAICAGNWGDELARSMVEIGAEVDPWSAAGLGLQGVLARHLDNGFKLNIELLSLESLEACQSRSLSVLDVAVLRNRPEIVKLLLSRGADPNLAGNLQPKPLNRALERLRHDTPRDDANLRVIARLLDGGADPNSACGPDGATPLHTAIGTNNTDAVAILLAHGARVCRNFAGVTPLQHAAKYGASPGIIDLLTWAGSA